ncbi:type III-B CRISPR-associated protein Cas10/Cmr2 [Candidatus Methylocalor cossyra]|uniref:CRISPR-associated protein Cas10/Cmr2, subtype III-B n=1 Tax=Candidatus Methylocalor cossyra TaxID=3108543 RepID=A0ABM9NK95_9GAMM
MANYLIALSIGPVQGFIAAARRTRDLWLGSWVLSEVSKAAAFGFYETNATLIFPAPSNADKELKAGSELNVGNKLLVHIETDNPREILENVKNRAQARWRELAEKARKNIKTEGVIDDAVWKRQIDDVLEFFGAWVRVDGPENYSAARDRVETLLAARKTTRDFKPAANRFDEPPGFGLRKSSLDAARETVFTEDFARSGQKDSKHHERFKHIRRRLGLVSGEHLDCPGLVKRFGGDPDQFPSVVRVALEAWLDTKKIPSTLLDAARNEYEKLVAAGLATRTDPARWRYYKDFPYDGGLLFPGRIESLRRDLHGESDQMAIAALDALRAERHKLYETYGQPTPYYAVLVADGDRMGKLIDDCTQIESHIAVTQALAGFADAAKTTVERHRGVCVYAGGDDVLALLPLHTAVRCAGELRKAFGTALENVSRGADQPPTLSVGLGIAHVLTPFDQARDLGKRAEKLAKGADLKAKDEQRNALAVLVSTRSGADFSVRGQWDSGIAERLEHWRTLFLANRLPDKTPYDLRAALARFAWAKERDDYAEIAVAEVERVLKKKRAEFGGRELSPEDRAEIASAVRDHGFETIVDELRVARWLAQKTED